MIPLHEATNTYMDHLRAQQKAPQTIASYRADIVLIQEYFGAETLLTEIRLPQVGRFLKSKALRLKKNGEEKAPISIEKSIRVLRQFFHWTQTHYQLEDLPLPKSVYVSSQAL